MSRTRSPGLAVALLLIATISPTARGEETREPRDGPARPAYAWRAEGAALESIADRIQPPAGFRPISAGRDSFGAWLRALPLRPGRPLVRLYDGRLKENQQAQEAVVDIDVGKRDLQQCADAVIRLRAEYLRASGASDEICFHLTNGDKAAWPEFRGGLRSRDTAGKLTWSKTARPDDGYASFRRYLDMVFTYAGTLSLSRELMPAKAPARVEIGDVFVQGGSPGHAVLVVDVAEDGNGHRVFLLAQSFMPAQEIHVLRNPGDPSSPWYAASNPGDLITPEWVFERRSLKRFPAHACQ